MSAIRISILMLALAGSMAAPGESLDEYVCKRGPDVRVVDVSRDRSGGSEQCAVHYRKETEVPGYNEALWRATGNTAFCRRKARGLVRRLAEWGWDCDEPGPAARWPEGLRDTVAAYRADLAARYRAAHPGARLNISDRRFALGDLDGDGDDDAVVQISIESDRAGISAAIAVFLDDGGGRFRHLATRTVRGRSFSWPTRVAIRGGRVVLTTSFYSRDDRGCCPTRRGRAVYEVVGTRLVEVTSN